jgi:hypothetical protein
MKWLSFPTYLIMVTSFLLLSSLDALSDDDKKYQKRESPTKSDSASVVVKSKKPTPKSKKAGKKVVEMPVYRPPSRGTPLGMVGGGTRGKQTALPLLVPIGPEHLGLTIQSKPTLYWYTSKPTDQAVVFTLFGIESGRDILKKRIAPPIQAGIHRIRLADFGKSLSKGIYRWSVFLESDPDIEINISSNILYIEFKEPSKALHDSLLNAGEEAINIYADSGIWYDAFSAVSDMIDAIPDEPNLRKIRAALLCQVGLKRIAESETID